MSTTPTSAFFAHANGFPSATYQTLFDALKIDHFHAIDKFGHSLPPGKSWKSQVPFYLEQLEKSSIPKPVVGIGHSMGGVITVLAAMERPELFRKLIILDPPLFSFKKRFLMKLFQVLNLGGRPQELQKRAARRKDTFASHKEAFEYFSKKGLFKRFDERALSNYVQHGFVGTGSGEITLDFKKEIESEFFATNLMLNLPKNTATTPGYLVYATIKPTLDDQDLAEQRTYYKHLKFVPFAGTHMFPMEEPESLAEMINDWVHEED